jgi:hypothetical protein
MYCSILVDDTTDEAVLADLSRLAITIQLVLNARYYLWHYTQAYLP